MRSVVLLSGGLDSVVNFKCAIDEGETVLALTFDYGQAAFENEQQAASLCAGRFGIAHRVVDLTWYSEMLPGPITGKGELSSHPDGIHSDRDLLLNEAWVPNRNCVFLGVGAAFAEAMRADSVVVGFNREEAEVFPDNSAAFTERMQRVLELSTLSEVKIVTHTGSLSKAEIVRLGTEINAPLDLVYSCYRRSADQRMCGLCQSCVRLKNALEENGLLEEMGARFAG